MKSATTGGRKRSQGDRLNQTLRATSRSSQSSTKRELVFPMRQARFGDRCSPRSPNILEARLMPPTSWELHSRSGSAGGLPC